MNDHDLDFDYTRIAHREGPLAEYLFDHLLALLQEARVLKDFHIQLRENCHSRPFHQIQEDYDIEDALLGGVTAEAEYKPDSFAKLTKRLLGLQFKNTEEAVARARADATIDTEVVVDETEMIELIDSVLDHSSEIIESAREVMRDWPPQSKELPEPEDWKSPTNQSELIALIEAPEDITERLRAFLEAAIQVLPNHDERALFIWTLDITPRYYLESAYPRLTEPNGEGVEDVDESWEGLKDLFGLEQQFHPEINGDDKQLKRDFTIYSYQPRSIGDHLIQIYSTIWESFESDELDEGSTTIREGFEVIIPDLPDPKRTFQSRAEKSLQELSGWNRPEDLDYLRVVDTTEEELEEYKNEWKRRRNNNLNTFESVRATTKAEYQIAELVLETCKYSIWGHSTSGNLMHDGREKQEDTDLQLPTVLQDLAPSLFLLHGIEYRLEIDADHMTVLKI